LQVSFLHLETVVALAGERGMGMAMKILGDVATDKRTGNHKLLLITGLTFVSVMFVFNDLFGLINGGGIFSVVTAYRAVGTKLGIVDVDGAGLRTLFAVASSLVVVIVGWWVNVDLEKRIPQLLVFLAIAGGAFVLDGIYDESLVTGFMTEHGYRRCENLDHDVGSGKGRVWFHNYALKVVDCPTR
jgi:hypothetical protein